MASTSYTEIVIETIAPPIASTNIELTQIPATAKDTETSLPFLVTFDESFDAENPKDWPDKRKWAVTNVLSAIGFNRIMVSTIMAPALSHIAADLHMNSTQSALALSIYLLATAFGPLAIGPLSEIYGREVVLHASNIWFLIWNIACGFATTKELLIAARFLAGFGASSIYALAGGALGDVWRPAQRRQSLGMYLLIPLLGAAVGPIIGGFMTVRASWRWIFWSTSIFQAVMVIFSFTAFRETFAPLILKRQAQRLRRDTGNPQYQTLQERLNHHQSALTILRKALTRPLQLLAFHPIIQISSIISAFNYGILYIVLSSFADLWIYHYHESVQISGLHYIACALGEVAGSLLGGPLMDHLFHRMKSHSTNNDPAPESRIPLIFPFALLAPLGLFIYGWTAQYSIHWLAVDTGIFIALFGMQIMGMAMQAYVMDTYSDETSSALAASQFLKSLTAFLFPLFAPAMYEALGYGWGNSIMGFVGLVFGFPAPLVILRFGARLRVKGKLK